MNDLFVKVGFFKLKDRGGSDHSLPLVLQIFFGFMVAGFLFTFLLPETKGKTLEELSGENEMSSPSFAVKELSNSISTEVSDMNDTGDSPIY